MFLSMDWEAERQFHQNLCWGVIYMALVVFLLLMLGIPTPMGKTLSSTKWVGPLLPPRLTWMFFESPCLIWSVMGLWQNAAAVKGINVFLLMLFVLHYVQRAIVYPIFLGGNTKPVPLAIVISAFAYTNVNGYLQAQGLCKFQSFPADWAQHAQFRLGLAMFVLGIAVNLRADAKLRYLRSHFKAYQIPHGGMFEYVSCAHYFGEIVEWIGFAVACHFSLASLSFCAFTAANLVPKAVSHHNWYQRNFSNYPKNRKAIIPFVW